MRDYAENSEAQWYYFGQGGQIKPAKVPNLRKITRFSAKLVERLLSERDVELAITSRRSLIGRYFHFGQERIGFWHPNTGVFVAWKPTPPTRIVSAFERHNGENYFRNLDAEPIRR